MKHTQTITIQVNGKTIQATVSLDAPGLEVEDCLSAQMILSAVANQQNMQYRSRHHPDRVASVTVRPQDDLVTQSNVRAPLRLVA